MSLNYQLEIIKKQSTTQKTVFRIKIEGDYRDLFLKQLVNYYIEKFDSSLNKMSYSDYENVIKRIVDSRIYAHYGKLEKIEDINPLITLIKRYNLEGKYDDMSMNRTIEMINEIVITLVCKEDISFYEIPISNTRIVNLLRRNSINTVYKLKEAIADESILKIKGFGKSIDYVKNIIDNYYV